MTARFTIVGLGEALFDIFPDRQVLGGAPLNVAVHAHQLAQPRGGRGVVVSRIGQDALGDALLADLRSRGMTTEYVQADPDRSTGTVYVDLADPARPVYDIVRGVAWDWLQFDPDAESLANQCQAVCFGTLAQREPESRNCILRFLTAAKRAVRLFDVNLRQKEYSAQILRRSCEASTVVKLNEDEMPIVADLLALSLTPTTPGADVNEKKAMALMKKYDLKMVALTRGPRGTVLLTPTSRFDGPPVSYDPEPGNDGVGAGDACAAAILMGLVQRWPLEKTVNVANHMGAYVASRCGATPVIPKAILEMA
jgi:fructokinase